VAAAAIILVAISAFMHAGWNLVSKRRVPPAAFFLIANLIGGACLLPVYIRYWHILPRIPPRVWLLLVLTGISLAVYYAALAGAYRAGHMSVAYPIARALPVLLVPAVEHALGLGRPLAAVALGGMVLVAAGCFILPTRGLAELRPRSYLNATCILALVTALGTTGYSTIDHEALAILTGSELGLGAVGSALVYAPLEAVSSSVFLGIYVLVNPKERRELGGMLRTGKGLAALTGIAIYLTYGLVLVAMSFVTNASYVVALRQLSIPVGAMLGVMILKEPRYAAKFVGIAVIVAGLVFVAAG
jgi:drug/metabolite transporter (DMT)-like permease